MSPALVIQASVPERAVHLDLQAPAGQVLALLGPNGAGKSTALALAAGTLRPGQGRVHVDGQEVAGPGRWVPPHRRQIALLAQEPLLLPHLDALGNVAFGPRAQGLGRQRSREIAQARLDEVGAAHLADRRPERLSGGQQQRIALARALAPDPQLLLLDEPLGALDIEAAAQMRQVLRTALRAAGRSAVIVTHDLLDVLALSSTVVVLDEGHILEQGPTLQVLTRPRSAFAARFAGVNLLGGTRAAQDAIEIGGAGGMVLHGISDGPAGRGQSSAATFSPRAVAVHHEPPGGSPRNMIAVQVGGIEQLGELVRVHGQGTGDLVLAADITPAALSGLGIEVGQDVYFAVKAAEVSIYPA